MRITLPTVLALDSDRCLDVDARTVSEALGKLVEAKPNLLSLVFSPGDRRLYAHISVFVNHVSIRRLGGIDTPLSATDEMHIIASIAGG